MRNLKSTLIFLLLLSCSTPQKVTAVVDNSKGLQQAPTFRVTTGSCDHEYASQEFWKIILAKNPQVWVWLGDNIYADTRSPMVMEAKYRKLLNDPDYKAFRKHVRITGTWDDHDYGENDAGADYPMKQKSKELFWDFMQEPKASAVRFQEGVYRSEIWSVGSKKVKLIILDTRYNRSELKENEKHEYVASDEGDMLGAQQWAWFEAEMADADYFDAIIVANGTEVLSDKHPFEKWANFPKAREHLLKIMEDAKSKIKILLSGDRHFGEISQLKFANGTQVTELMTSGLTHNYEKANEENVYRVGNLWPQKNFGMIDFYDDPTNGLSAVLTVNDITTGNDAVRVEVKGDASVPTAR